MISAVAMTARRDPTNSINANDGFGYFGSKHRGRRLLRTVSMTQTKSSTRARAWKRTMRLSRALDNSDYSDSRVEKEREALTAIERDISEFSEKDLMNEEKQRQILRDRREKTRVDKFKDNVDLFLLYDFFVIVAILAWLVVGVCVRLGVYNKGLSYDEPVLGTWLFLWPFLFQPLLGVHMLATLVSPLIGKLKEKGILGEDAWQ